jgi:hypothetical protein
LNAQTRNAQTPVSTHAAGKSSILRQNALDSFVA